LGRGKGSINMERGFRFVAEKVYAIPGRGVVVTGKVESGSVSAGSEIGFLGTEGRWMRAMVIGIEVNRRLVEEAQAGQQASILLEGVRKDQVTLGTVLLEVPADMVPPPVPSPEPGPRPAISASSPSYPGEAIHPSSSLWRTVLFLIIGVLIILAILYFQGIWSPRKIMSSSHPPGFSDKKIAISMQQSAFSQAEIPTDLWRPAVFLAEG
jgi:hypothetical protein